MIYIAGSMSQRERILSVSQSLRDAGYEVFNDWINPGENTDEKWLDWQKQSGFTFLEALYGPHATNVFEFDKRYIDTADAFVLVYPAGKSGHTELGYASRAVPSYVLLDGEPTRWDVMLRFATKVVMTVEELVKELDKSVGRPWAPWVKTGPAPVAPNAPIRVGWQEPQDWRIHPCPDPGQEPLDEESQRLKDGLDRMLDARHKTHGSYFLHAEYTQRIKSIIEDAEIERMNRGQNPLTNMQLESLHMIAHKIGRILAGDPSFDDHWDDIAGYAKLHKGHTPH